MRSLSFEISGEVSGQITITELEDGTLRFDIAQVSDADVLGDLRAIFFDFDDESLLGGLSVEGADVTDWAFDADSISTLGKDANIKGEIINELGKFDGGVEFGTSGMSKDDIQTTSFVLSHDSVALNLDLLGQQDFGLRMTSVGTEEDGRNGSLKLGGTSTAAPDAIDDSITTDEDTAADETSPGNSKLLANDTDADGDLLTITEVNGIAANVGSAIQVAEGASLTVNSDGTFDINPNGAFESLAVGESTTDSFAYTVSDGNGGTDTATVTITINGVNDAPTANDDAATTDEDNPTIIPAAALLANDTDPDASDTLSVASIDTTGTTGMVTDNGDGTFTYDPNGQFESLAVGEEATDSFAYTVSDGNGGTDTATVTITINGVNDAPTANDDAATTDEDNPTIIPAAALLANDTDPDASDVLSVQSIDSSATTGLVTDNGDGTFTYDPNGQFESLAVGEEATDSFAYTVSDGNGGTDTATVTITINGVNDAPTANDDVETTGQDSSVIIDVLANDSDPDTSDILEVDSLDNTGTLGVANVRSDGRITYDPAGQFDYLAADESASDQFSYIVSDGNGGTDTATVTVTINGVNDAPDAVVDSVVTDEDTPTGITAAALLLNDSDPDASDVLSLESIDSIATTGVVTDNLDGTFTYDPNGQFESLAVGEEASDSFSYTISDGNGGTDTATVNITISGVNDAPTANDDVASTDEGTPTAAIVVMANDTDPDASDVLAVADFDATSALGATVTDNGDGTFTYNPNGQFESLAVGEEASDSFSYTISDGNGGTDTATVTVTINGIDGNAPIAADDLALTDEDTAIASIPVLANDMDPDTDVLTVQSVDTTGTIGQVTLNSDSTFAYDPNGAFESLAVGESTTDSFTYTVSDGNGGTDTATVTITINGVNDAPVADDDSYSVSEDSALSIGVPGVLGGDTDVDASDVLTVTDSDATSALGATVSVNPNGSFSYDPRSAATLQALASGQSAVDTFTYTVDDGNGGTDTATVDITVLGRNEGSSGGGGTQIGKVAQDIPPGADLDFYVKFDGAGAEEWLKLEGFQLGFAQEFADGSKAGGGGGGRPTAEDAVLFLGGDSAALTTLRGSLVGGKALDKAQIVAVVPGKESQSQVVDAYAFEDVLLTELDMSSGSEQLSFTFSAFTHEHTGLDMEGKAQSTAEISWDFVTNTPGTSVNIEAFDSRDIEFGDSSEATHYVRLGDADWLELEGFDFTIDQAVGTLSGGKDRDRGSLVADDVVLTLGSSGALTLASLDLFDGDLLQDVEIESYRMGGDAKMQLVEEFHFEDVALTGLDTNRGDGGEMLSFNYQKVTQSYGDYGSDGKSIGQIGQWGYDFELGKATDNVPAPNPDLADVTKVAQDIPPGADLDFYVKFDGAGAEEWLKLEGFQLGFAQEFADGSKAGGGGGGRPTAEDAVLFLGGDSAALTTLRGSLVGGKALDKAQIVAVVPGKESQSQVVDAYAFEDVLLTELDMSSGSEQLSFTFSAFTHEHTGLDMEGKAQSTAEISWDFVTNTPGTSVNIEAFDSRDIEFGDSSEATHYVRLGDADWLELEGFDFTIDQAVGTLSGGKDRDRGSLVADDVVLTLGSSGALTLASLDLFDGDLLQDVEIESYRMGGDAKMQLVEEFHFEDVALTGLDTNRGDGGEMLSFNYQKVTQSYGDYGSDGKSIGQIGQWGYDFELGKATDNVPAPNPDLADVTKVAQDIPPGADLDFYVKFDGAGAEEWLKLEGFQLGFAQEFADGSKAGGGGGGRPTAEDAVLFLGGDSAALTTLRGSLVGGKALDKAQIVAVVPGKESQSQVVDAYAFEDVLLTELDMSSGSEQLSFTFSAFTHEHTGLDMEGKAQSTAEISWDFVTNTPGTSVNIEAFDSRDIEFGDSSEATHYVRLGDADWLELEGFDFTIDQAVGTLSGGKDRDRGSLVADDVVLTLGSSGALTLASLDLFDGDLLQDVEIESYRMGGDAKMQLVEEFHFEDVALTGLDTNRGDGGEMLSFNYQKVTQSYGDYGSDGKSIGQIGQWGYDFELGKATDNVPALDPDVFV